MGRGGWWWRSVTGMATDYKWLADSIRMAGDTITQDLLVALDHAANVPGKQLTPARVDRLVTLANALDATKKVRA